MADATIPFTGILSALKFFLTAERTQLRGTLQDQKDLIVELAAWKINASNEDLKTACAYMAAGKGNIFGDVYLGFEISLGLKVATPSGSLAKEFGKVVAPAPSVQHLQGELNKAHNLVLEKHSEDIASLKANTVTEVQLRSFFEDLFGKIREVKEEVEQLKASVPAKRKVKVKEVFTLEA